VASGAGFPGFRRQCQDRDCMRRAMTVQIGARRLDLWKGRTLGASSCPCPNSIMAFCAWPRSAGPPAIQCCAVQAEPSAGQAEPAGRGGVRAGRWRRSRAAWSG